MQPAAAGLRAWVYLQQGDFTNATATNRVIASGKYSLNANYADSFVSATTALGNSAEDVFAVQLSSQGGLNQLNVFYPVTRRTGINVLPQFSQPTETGDTRRNLLTTNTRATHTNKYDALYGNSKLMRLAGMYLTRTEADFRAGTTVGAAPLADISAIRTRAKLPVLTALTLPPFSKKAAWSWLLGASAAVISNATKSQLSARCPPTPLPGTRPSWCFPSRCAESTPTLT
jgi:hypothetical protein